MLLLNSLPPPPPAPITFNLDSRGTVTCLASYNDPIFNLKPLDPRSNTTIICLVLLDIFSFVIRDLRVCVGRGRGKTERQRKGRGEKRKPVDSFLLVQIHSRQSDNNSYKETSTSHVILCLQKRKTVKNINSSTLFC